MRRRLTGWIAALTAITGLFCAPADDPPPSATDTDGDGLSDVDEINLYGTSPVLADTDGDGWSDFAEVVTYSFDPANNPYRFNPRVADIPIQTIVFTSPPDITIQLTVDNGTVHTFETSEAALYSVTDTNAELDHNAQSNTIETPVTVTQETSVTAPLPKAPGDGGADAGEDGGGDESPVTVTNTTSVASTVDPSTTVETAVDLTREEAQQYADTLTETESFAQSNDVTASAGVFKLTAVVENQGHVAFRVINVTLTASIAMGPNLFIPVDNLAITEGDFTTYQPFALSPGQEAPVNFVSNPLTLETTERVLANVGQLVVELGAYEIDDSTGKPFSFDFTDIGAKTATIGIDYGGARPSEVFLTATNLDPSAPGITAAKAFADILRIPFDSDPKTGLTVVRDVGTNASGVGNWTLTLVHDSGADITTTHYDATESPYDFKTIVLRGGDTLHLVHRGSAPPHGGSPLAPPRRAP